jgi:hypothetical protein
LALEKASGNVMFAMMSRREYGETVSVLADWNIADNHFYL